MDAIKRKEEEGVLCVIGRKVGRKMRGSKRTRRRRGGGGGRRGGGGKRREEEGRRMGG